MSPLNLSYINNQMLLLFKQGLYLLGLFSQCLSPGCTKKQIASVPYIDPEGLLWVLSAAAGKRQYLLPKEIQIFQYNASRIHTSQCHVDFGIHHVQRGMKVLSG